MEDYLGKNTGKLGFGLMRLPKNGEEFDLPQICEMVDKFLEAGFTYFDTAWAYKGSEETTRKALVERHPRDSYTLATKLPARQTCQTREEALAPFYESLERTGAGYFDYFLLHNLGEQRTAFFEKFDVWNFALQKKEEGLIRHLGFSFHDTADKLEAILQAHPEAEFVQLQINYADWESPRIQSRKCYEVCRKYNKPVVIMEPVKGGLLANPPAAVADILKAAEPDSSLASWGVRFAADLPGLITVLSGMSTLQQVEDNVSFMKEFRGLTEAQKETLAKAREAMAAIPIIPCTTCNYCADVCPMNIGISGTFNAYNTLTVYGSMKNAQGDLDFQVKGKGKAMATECIQCGACMEVCPQHIEIPARLQEACKALAIE
ncbi:MAG: aldo/keto reductase [Clostridia bacterium]|nr:aldo/keto reductase [Clostridia bacterium]